MKYVLPHIFLFVILAFLLGRFWCGWVCPLGFFQEVLSIVRKNLQLNHFNLLREIFEKIAVPEGVYAEVVIEGWGFSGSLETSEAVRAGLLKVVQVMDKEKVKEISERYRMSISNAEVIQLAKEMGVEFVLADEEEVREAAEAAGFKVRGCLGILIEAVKSKFMPSQQAIQDIDNLLASGYCISEDIVGAIKDTLQRWRG